MLNRWLIASLVGLTLVNAQAYAMMDVRPEVQAAVDRILKPLEEDLLVIARKISAQANSKNLNPFELCRQYGRLQSFADILAVKIDRLSSAKNFQPEAQALLLSEYQKRHLSIDRKLQGLTTDCDRSFSPSELRNDTASLTAAVIKRLNGIGAEDPMVACFHLGRLGMLRTRLKFENRTEKLATNAALIADAAQAIRKKQKTKTCTL